MNPSFLDFDTGSFFWAYLARIFIQGLTSFIFNPPLLVMAINLIVDIAAID